MEAVTIVVQPVAGNLSGVVPDVVGQIRVGVVDARVQYHQQNVATPGADVPGLFRAAVGSGGSLGLAMVVQAPLFVEACVIGEHRGLDQVVGLGVEDMGMAAKAFQGLFSVQEISMDEGNPLQDELTAFLKSCQDRTRPVVSGADGCAAVEIAERVQKAIAANSW